VATNVSVRRSDSRCLEAKLATMMTSGGLAEAKLIRADLRDRYLWDLPPEPGETSIPVDDIPNPFSSPKAADRYLRSPGSSGEDPSSGSWKQEVDYIAARAFRVVSEIGAEALPGLSVFGTGDGLSGRERARRIDDCVRCKRPFAAIKPIDGITRFLAVDSEERYASVAIVVRTLQHVAIAVACGSRAAVGTHHTVLVQRDGDIWIPASELPDLPVLHASIAAPISTPGHGELQAGTLIPEWGNPILLNGVVFGAVEAAYQPDCWPCDCAGVYLAAAAGRTTVRAINGRRIIHPYEIQARLINALRKGDKVSGLIVARDELAAHRLLNHLRQCGIA
jgi:hypothetical protein